MPLQLGLFDCPSMLCTSIHDSDHESVQMIESGSKALKLIAAGSLLR